jgi:hypothetical protein
MQPNSIEIYPEAGRWIVRIVEDGIETVQQFLVEEHAHSWASGQSQRIQQPIEARSSQKE